MGISSALNIEVPRQVTTGEEELESLEIQLLLMGVARLYGFDFRNYAMASLRRRLRGLMRAEGLETISGLLERLLHDSQCMERLIRALTSHATSMFQDSSFHIALRQKIIPMLRNYPVVRIWHVGCSTGEELYSIAIVLKEEGLYDRCRIYATDLHAVALADARAGAFVIDRLEEFERNYIRAGGQRSLADYYSEADGLAVFHPELRANITFSEHNLVTDSSFNEFNVIFCRDVMIYFDETLQSRVHNLLFESLRRFGVLALGRGESIKRTPYEAYYQAIEPTDGLYRRAADAR